MHIDPSEVARLIRAGQAVPPAWIPRITELRLERSYLSDADADAYREQLRKQVQEYCGSVPQFDPNAPIPAPQPIAEPKVNPAAATSR